jgi:hypothetical protein
MIKLLPQTHGPVVDYSLFMVDISNGAITEEILKEICPRGK